MAYHYPDEMPLGSFELLASNKIRSDEETLGEVFNGDAYYCDKAPAEDPEFDWVPRKEQVRRCPWWRPGVSWDSADSPLCTRLCLEIALGSGPYSSRFCTAFVVVFRFCLRAQYCNP